MYSEPTLSLAENLFLEHVCACSLVSDLLEIRHSASCMTKFLSLDVFARFLVNMHLMNNRVDGCKAAYVKITSREVLLVFVPKCHVIISHFPLK